MAPGQDFKITKSLRDLFKELCPSRSIAVVRGGAVFARFLHGIADMFRITRDFEFSVSGDFHLESSERTCLVHGCLCN
jgi:hypothetical protein